MARAARRLFLALALLLAPAGALASDAPTPPLASQVEAARAAFDAKDPHAIETLAASLVDPWPVVDELIGAGRKDVAAAVAKARTGREAAALLAYATNSPDEPPDARAQWVRAQTLASSDAAAALKILAHHEQLPEGALRARWLEARGSVLAGKSRSYEAARDFEAASETAERLGWLSLAAADAERAGSLYLRGDDLVEARLAWQRLRRVHEAQGELGKAASDRANIGLSLVRSGEVAEGARELTEARSELTAARMSGARAFAGLSLATALRQLGRYAEAVAVLEESRSFWEKAHKPAAAAVAVAELGNFYARLGDVGRARTYLEDARRALRAQTPASKVEADEIAHHLRIVDGQMGMLLFLEGAFDEAVQALIAARDAFTAAGETALAAKTLLLLSNAYLRAEDPKRALSAAAEAAAALGVVGDAAGQLVAEGNRGEALEQLGRVEAALRVHEDVRDKAALRGLDPVVLDQRICVARTRLRLGNVSGAITEAEAGIRDLVLQYRALGDADAVSARATFAALFDVGMDAAVEAGDLDRFVRFLEASRAGSLLDALGNRDALSDADAPPALVKRRDAARSSAATAAAAQTRALSTPEIEDDRVAAAARRYAENELQAAEAALADSARGRAHLRYPQPATAAQIRESLEPGDALVEYAWSAHAVRAVVFSRDAAPRLVEFGDPAPIEAAIDALTKHRGDADARTLVSALRAKVFVPLALPATMKRLLVSPDGPLVAVPFGLLLEADPWPIVHVPSGTTHRWLRSVPIAKSDEVLAFGDPDYGTGPDAPAVAMMRGRGYLSRLPRSREEVTAIGTTVVVGADATETEFRRRIAAATALRALHIACHGLIDPERPSLSALALAPSPTDDGLLTALEIYSMRIPAQLVVLSACETGRGRIARGEGLIGLTRSFLAAGAAGVVVSLWDVDDDATRALMTKFYEAWRAGDAPAVALRKAQAAIRSMEKWKGIEYWGAWALWGRDG